MIFTGSVAMISTLSRVALLCLLLLAPCVGSAQESGTMHPLLANRWLLTAGAFFSYQDSHLRASGNLPGDEVDFNNRVGVDDSETAPIFMARWRFGEKWSLWGQAWSTSNQGRAILTEDIVWQDLVFSAGTNVAGGIESRVVRLFFGRTVSTGPRHEFGAGLGFHWLEIGAYLQGDVLTSFGDVEFARSGVDAALPLPNIGAWYEYALTDRWLIGTRVDWLSASVGDYSGSLWNASLGVQWQMTDHFGLGLNYQLFRLNGDVRDENWRGGAELANHGPLLSLTASW